MKKAYLIIATLCILFACSKEDVAPVGKSHKSVGNNTVFHATTEATSAPGTKLFVEDDLKFKWNEEDYITIFNWTDYNAPYMFMGEDGDNAGDFEDMAEEHPNPEDGGCKAIDHIYAVYPYSPDIIYDSDNYNHIIVDLPAEQNFNQQSYGGIGVNTMVAVTEDNFLPFKNVCGYLKFSLYGHDFKVKSIKFEGNNVEKIAGKAHIYADYEELPTVSMDETATGKLTINCTTPITLGTSKENSTHFIFVIPPTTFTNGFKITITDPYGKTIERTSTKSLVIERNKMESMAPLQVAFDYTKGAFSVSDSKQVYFATGNLEKKNSLWRMCNWYEYGDAVSSKYLDFKNNSTDVYIDDVNKSSGWYMLTRLEWNYLVKTRTMNNGVNRWYRVTTNSTNGNMIGLLLPPDTATASEVSGLSDGATNVNIERYLALGFVFLPTKYSEGILGYWTCTVEEGQEHYMFRYHLKWSSSIEPNASNSIVSDNFSHGAYVRVARDVTES